MARFRGTVQGSRGEASRLGSTNGGLVTNTNGWDAGVRVVARVDDEGRDTFAIYATGGSSGSHRRLIGHVVDGPDGPVVEIEPAERALALLKSGVV
jgi:hypothetical protein